MRVNNRPVARVVERIFSTNIDVVDWDSCISEIDRFGVNKYICIVNVHSLVTAELNSDFSNVLNSAAMATPDGAPLAFLIRRRGHKGQCRINGPDLMMKYFSHAENTGFSVFLYGGSQFVLDKLLSRIRIDFPNLKIAGFYSPPYRPLSPDERADIIGMINSSGATSVWVGLGCPKQEFWMFENAPIINATLVGVGAAFDYHAMTLKRAPIWMQNYGFEWFYRAIKEPRRLFWRYFSTNFLFFWFLFKYSFAKFFSCK